MKTPSSRVGFPSDLVLQQKEKASFIRKVKSLFDQCVEPKYGPIWDLVKLSYEDGATDRKARKLWKSYALEEPVIVEFLRYADPSGMMQSKLLDKLLKVAWKEKDARSTWTSIATLIDKRFIEKQREESKDPLRSVGIPPEIIEKFIPAPFSFEVGPGGELLKEFSVFGNKRKTIERKGRDMARILSQWNVLVDKINADMTSANPSTRLCAIISYLMLQTGIRPGFGGKSRLKENGKVIKDENGKPTYIKTFGATGLRLEHLEFIRDDFAKLEFPGKAGTVNVTYLTDTDLIRALKTQVESLKNQDPGGLLFVTNDGRKISNLTINKYLKRILGPTVSATDFRKLRATEVFYKELRDTKQDLVDDLKSFKVSASDAIVDKVVEVIINHLEKAVDKASKTISHKSHKVTIESYITPRVVLMFLTDGGIQRELPEIIGSGSNLKVSFDARSFYEKVTGIKLSRRAALKKVASLFSPGTPFTDTPPDALIETLEEELGGQPSEE